MDAADWAEAIAITASVKNLLREAQGVKFACDGHFCSWIYCIFFFIEGKEVGYAVPRNVQRTEQKPIIMIVIFLDACRLPYRQTQTI